MSSAYFVSDVHLNRMASPSGEAMLLLLERAKKDASLFVILGDLFDIWVGEGRAFQQEYAPIIRGFEELKSKCRILYFEGNHDFHLEKFWKNKMGFEIFTGPQEISFGKTRIWAEHGDEINRDDHGYLALRALLRFPPVKFAIEHLPSSFVFRVGSGASHVSRRYTDHKADPVLKIFRDYARLLRGRHEFDLLVTGHTHVPDDFEFDVSAASGGSRKSRLINLGSWFDGPHFLKISELGSVEHVLLPTT